MKWMWVAVLAVVLSLTQAALALESINVNTAGVEQLAQSLEGVGMARAQAIVEYRDKFGPFVDLEDLQEVSGIGPALIETNKDRIVFSE